MMNIERRRPNDEVSDWGHFGVHHSSFDIRYLALVPVYLGALAVSSSSLSTLAEGKTERDGGAVALIY
jgi:hypothetical protein